MSGEGLKLIKIEGLAMSGFIDSVYTESCDKKRVKIIARTKSGEKIETECIEADSARRNIGVIRLYLRWSPYINKG